ncbi:MAG: hypothetical protein IPN69_18560 [Acidobacteria bacterium]|nr:hypothetical protein [Acidobacteriota bacterium]
MKPVGYNAKFIEKPESWLGNAAVEEILSVSECFSESPIDHTTLWLCNRWRLYDTIDALEKALAATEMEDACSLRRFFYEAHPEAVLDGEWEPIEEVPTGVVGPGTGFELRGYDIVCFTSGPAPECSPLSCNSGAKQYQVNRHCLLRTLEEALAVVREIDADGGYEPGPYGIMSVWEAANKPMQRTGSNGR